jgi:hypothetical protein
MAGDTQNPLQTLAASQPATGQASLPMQYTGRGMTNSGIGRYMQGAPTINRAQFVPQTYQPQTLKGGLLSNMVSSYQPKPAGGLISDPGPDAGGVGGDASTGGAGSAVAGPGSSGIVEGVANMGLGAGALSLGQIGAIGLAAQNLAQMAIQSESVSPGVSSVSAVNGSDSQDNSAVAASGGAPVSVATMDDNGISDAVAVGDGSGGGGGK